MPGGVGDDVLWSTSAEHDAETPGLLMWVEADPDEHTLDFFMQESDDLGGTEINLPPLGAGLDRQEVAVLSAVLVTWLKADANATCTAHRPVQNRDGKAEWCRTCGLTVYGLDPGDGIVPAVPE